MSFEMTPLVLESIPGTRLYKVRDEFTIRMTGVYGNPTEYSVPAGFVTDLITSPRFAWSFIPPGNYGREAAVVHDYLLNNGYPRTFCDKVFRRILDAMDIKSSRAFAMYHGVRLYSLFVRKFESKRD